MAEEECECIVQVVSAFSDESLSTVPLPSSSTVLQVKGHVQAAHGVNVFRQRLLVSPAGREVEDHEVLATLPDLRLQLVRLEYADADAEVVARLLHASEGATHEVGRLLRQPLHPDCSQGRDPETPLILSSTNGHLEVVQLLCKVGADKDKVDGNGGTALTRASAGGRLEVVRMLCDAGPTRTRWMGVASQP